MRCQVMFEKAVRNTSLIFKNEMQVIPNCFLLDFHWILTIRMDKINTLFTFTFKNTCPFLMTQLVKESACSAGDLGLIPGSVTEIPW